MAISDEERAVLVEVARLIVCAQRLCLTLRTRVEESSEAQAFLVEELGRQGVKLSGWLA
jgi:hypothetical protein